MIIPQASINGDNWLSYDWNKIYKTNQNTANWAPITRSRWIQIENLENGEFDFVLFLHDFVETLEDFFEDKVEFGFTEDCIIVRCPLIFHT